MASSTVARWELARRIKLRRHELNIGVDKIVKHLGFSRNFFSAVENERAMLAADKLAKLLDLLKFDDEEKAELTALSEAARDRGWWESKADLISDEGARLFGLEQGACEIRTFDALSVPGLLQIADYTKAVFLTDPMRAPATVDDLLTIRTRRQRDALQRDVPISALISEAAVRQQWGGSQLHQRQLGHIIDVAGSDNVEVRILTFDVSPGALVGCATLVLMSFDSPHLPVVGYQEAVRGLAMLEEGDPQFERLRLAWEDGAERALDQDESIEFIHSVLSNV